MFDLTKFAEQQLAEATAEFMEKSRASDAGTGSNTMKIEPRLFFVKLPEGLATNVANYPELDPMLKRFFNSVEGKTALGRWIAMMIGTGLVDAVVIVIEAFFLVLDKDEAATRDESVEVRNDPRRRQMLLVEIITKDSVRAISQELKDGVPDGEPRRLGYDGVQIASSRFAPHLDPRPVGTTLQ
jgi:predicted PurR-regulated permease PerM